MLASSLRDVCNDFAKGRAYSYSAGISQVSCVSLPACVSGVRLRETIALLALGEHARLVRFSDGFACR